MASPLPQRRESEIDESKLERNRAILCDLLLKMGVVVPQQEMPNLLVPLGSGQRVSALPFYLTRKM